MQRHLVDAALPFCAFNGGADVFVDVGNKSLGLEALMAYLGFNAPQVQIQRSQKLSEPRLRDNMRSQDLRVNKACLSRPPGLSSLPCTCAADSPVLSERASLYIVDARV